ncbi:MAG: DNA-binding response regulator, partial [Acidobacteria bacterium]
MPNSEPVRIILLAKQPVVRAGLRHLLAEQEGLKVIADCSSTTDAIAVARREEVDILLVDPDCEEIALRAVSAFAELGNARILVFSAETDPLMFARAIELGACGVVSKHQSAELLIRAIRKVHAGEVWLDRAATASVLTRAVRRGRDPEVMKIESLTKREREIVTLLGEGLRNTVIAERLFISEATVRNHLTSILSKLGLANRFELAIFAFRNHLIASPDVMMARPRIAEDARRFRHEAADRSPGWSPREAAR